MFLAVNGEQLIESFAGLFGRIVKVAVAAELSGNHFENGQPAGVRVGNGFENKRRKRCIRIRGALNDLIIGWVGPRFGPFFDRGGQAGDHEIHEQVDADVAGRRAAQHRRKGSAEQAFFQRVDQLLVGDGLAFQVAFDQGVVSFGHVFDQGFPFAFRQRLHVRRNLHFGGLAVVVVAVGFQRNQIDNSLEIGLCADGKLENNRFGCQALGRVRDGAGKIGAFTVQFVDEDSAGHVIFSGKFGDLFRLHLDAVHRIHQDQRDIRSLEALLGIGYKVLVTGRVNQTDGVFFPWQLKKSAG